VNRKERRKIRPHEQARVDQVRASVRDRSIKEPNTRIFFLQFINVGERQCCWCDCPMEAHTVPGYRCAGCQSGAIASMEEWNNGVPTGFPLCHKHLHDYRKQFLPLLSTKVLESGGEFQEFAYDAYGPGLG
jgi:hypothetical protein